MKALVIGASGTVGRPLAAALAADGHDVRRAGRGPDADTRFDWFDPDTHAQALHGVEAVHIVQPPGVLDVTPHVLPFLDLARSLGVERFTLQGSSAVPRPPRGMNDVTVLRPTWFASNLTDRHAHADSVRSLDEIVTATGSGRIPFIDPTDIAAVAAAVLTGSDRPEELVLTGPRPISFDEAVEALSRFTGRTITHRRVTVGELADRWAGTGLPREFADALAAMDAAIADGSEDRVTDAVERVLGRPARTFEEFLASRRPEDLGRS